MAAKYDDRTLRGWPLPVQGNRLYDDVERLREALTLIDKSITDVDTHESAISERQDFIETRMDVIVGQATEDTEILDARVDAEGVVHPNIGHAIRNAHATLVVLLDDFQGLLRQFSVLAEAQIQGELNSFEAHKRRKKEIELEVLTRLTQDGELQRQINEASTAILQMSLNLYDVNEHRKADIENLQSRIEALSDTLSQYKRELEQEIRDRIDHDDSLQGQLDAETQARVAGDLGLARQANANAEAIIRTNLNLLDANDRLKTKLSREEQVRIAGVADVQAQVDTLATATIENSLAITHEAEQRRKVAEEAQDNFEYLCDEDARLDAEIEAETAEREAEDDALQADINAEKVARTEQTSRLDDELNAETQARVAGDLELARQANANAEAIIRTNLNLLEANERRKADLMREEKSRIEHDSELRTEVDRVAEASLKNTLAIGYEAEQRRKDIADETQERIAQNAHQQSQTDTLSAAVIHNALAIADEAQKRREVAERLIEEVHDREREINALLARIGELYEIPLPGIEERFASLQSQADKNAEAIIENSLNIYDESERRRKSFTEILNALRDEISIRTQNEAHSQSQIDALTTAIFEDALNLYDEVSRRRAAISEETQARMRGDADLQIQVDRTSETSIENSLAIAYEAEQRRKFGDRIDVLERKAELSGERDTYHQTQLDALTIAILQDALNLNDEAERRRADTGEVRQALADKIAILQAQVNKNAETIIESSLTVQNADEVRRAEDIQERFTRFSEDASLQDQINTLATTCLLIMTIIAEMHAATHTKLNKIAEIAKSISGSTGVASDTEVDEMFDEIYNF